MARVTVFTPTYNRANTLYRVYNSLVQQTYKDLMWIVIDDGSADNTKEVVDGYIDEGKIKIEYRYQHNQGKHIAINHAVSIADSELFVIADSDDAFTPEAIEVLVKTWDSIPEENKPGYKGVICRCFDSETGMPIGTFPEKVFDSNDLDANFKLKLNFEKWMLFRTDVLREFPFPDVGNGLKFYPETIIWQQMGRKYKTRYVDAALREYFRDQENALTHVKTPRFKENVHLWEHRVNNTMDYFWNNPYFFLKAFVGLTRDHLVLGKKLGDIIKIPNTFWKKLCLLAFYPVGWALSLKFKEK